MFVVFKENSPYWLSDATVPSYSALSDHAQEFATEGDAKKTAEKLTEDTREQHYYGDASTERSGNPSTPPTFPRP